VWLSTVLAIVWLCAGQAADASAVRLHDALSGETGAHQESGSSGNHRTHEQGQDDPDPTADRGLSGFDGLPDLFGPGGAGQDSLWQAGDLTVADLVKIISIALLSDGPGFGRHDRDGDHDGRNGIFGHRGKILDVFGTGLLLGLELQSLFDHQHDGGMDGDMDDDDGFADDFDGDHDFDDGGSPPVVPLPAAAWLLAGGLGLLGFFRRRAIQK